MPLFPRSTGLSPSLSFFGIDKHNRPHDHVRYAEISAFVDIPIEIKMEEG